MVQEENYQLKTIEILEKAHELEPDNEQVKEELEFLRKEFKDD